LYPAQFDRESPARSLMKFYRKMGVHTVEVVLLSLVDRLSTCGEGTSETSLAQSKKAHLGLIEQYFLKKAQLEQAPLLNGNEIMALLNVTPGPHLKQYRDALLEAQHLEQVTTAEAAKQFMISRFGLPRNP
jgi:tRNA nucleotidyltransferase/poly(A) polymerase